LIHCCKIYSCFLLRGCHGKLLGRCLNFYLLRRHGASLTLTERVHFLEILIIGRRILILWHLISRVASLHRLLLLMLHLWYLLLWNASIPTSQVQTIEWTLKMIDGHNSFFGDGIFSHKLKSVLIQFLEGYLAVPNVESIIY
jgi:hypothetical protein